MQKIATTVKELKELRDEGEPMEIGEIVLDKNGMQWRLVDRKPDGTLILFVTELIDVCPFDIPSKKHRWGSNDYMTSYLRKMIQGEYMERLFGDEKEEVITMYAPSMEEVGFAEPEKAFEWFRASKNVSSKEIQRRRVLELDDEPDCWWHRSPYPSDGGTVRRTGASSGGLYYDSAGGGYAVAAACQIM